MREITFTTFEQDKFNFKTKSKHQLFEIYSNLSDILSKTIFKQYRYNFNLEYKEVKQLTDISLWNILDKYDVSKQVKFTTFAFNKVPFLVKDELRTLTKSRRKYSNTMNAKCYIEDANIKDFLLDDRDYSEKEKKMIQSIIKILKQSGLPKLSIDIFIKSVLFQEKNETIGAKYNISKSRVSQHCIKIKQYLQDFRNEIEY